jgi:hypothetical protein
MLRSTGLFFLIVVTCSSVSFAQECLHGPNESAAERERREYAIWVASEINRLQAGWIAANPAAAYARPSQLKLPKKPSDFGLTFFVDGRRHMFTLKDDKDPCNFGIFSDHDGLIYAAMPQPDRTAISEQVPR